MHVFPCLLCFKKLLWWQLTHNSCVQHSHLHMHACIPCRLGELHQRQKATTSPNPGSLPATRRGQPAQGFESLYLHAWCRVKVSLQDHAWNQKEAWSKSSCLGHLMSFHSKPCTKNACNHEWIGMRADIHGQESQSHDACNGNIFTLHIQPTGQDVEVST